MTNKTTAFKRLFIAFLLLLLILAGIGSCTALIKPPEAPPVAQRGVLSLADYSWSPDELVPLNGEWRFYPNRLIPPTRSQEPFPQTSIQVPSSWQGVLDPERPSQVHGYGTYALTLKLPPGLGNHHWGLEIPAVFASYSLWVNKALVAAGGTVATDASAAIPSRQKRIVQFESDAEELRFVLQASNFTNPVGGVTQRLLFGTGSAIAERHTLYVGIELFLTGSLAIMALYHIGLFVYRPKAGASLFFGLFCLAIAVRGLFTGETIIYSMLPGMSWSAAIHIEYTGLAISVMLLAWFYQRVYPREMHPAGAILVSIGCTAYAVLTLAAPPVVFTAWLKYFQLFMLLATGYGLYVFVLAVARGREGSLVSIFGVFCLSIATVNDILFSAGLLRTGFFMTLGLFCFVITQAFILAAAFSKAITDSERLSVELQGLNISLEAIVLERTTELAESNRTLERLSQLDGLTGIYNRRHFNEIAAQLLAEQIGLTGGNGNPPSGTWSSLSLLLIDVDHFKAYNDTYGHLGGDEVLKRVAQVLQQEAETVGGALAARYGGEEFAVLASLPLLEAESLAARLVSRIRELALPHAVSPTAPYVTISCGVACFGSQASLSPASAEPAHNLPRLIEWADAALYQAKYNGRNRHQAYTSN